MTTVSINEVRDNFVISIEGAAEWRDTAADWQISIITSTLVNSILWAVSDGEAKTNIDLDTFDPRDDINFEVEPFDGCKDKLQTIIDTCMEGFSLIEEAYPDYIEIG